MEKIFKVQSFKGEEMSRKDTILRAAKRTAEEVRAAAAKNREFKGRKNKNFGIAPHRHCLICWKPISLENEDGVCDSENCGKINNKRQKSRKRWSILLYVFAGFFFVSIIFQYLASNT
tara:strand:+ start:6 stop:359 length:354 start_codon:yes stop_codon:yes gene_type:complete